MEIIEVPDIKIAKDNAWHPLRDEAVAKDGFKTFGAGCGVAKGGNWHVLDSPYVTIAGLKWAKTNLIADPNDATGMTSKFANNIESGDFYQWGRKKAWKATEDKSGWDSTVDVNTAWNKATGNDPSPDGWRIPTAEECASLISATTGTNRQYLSAGSAAGNTVAGWFLGDNAITATVSDLQGCLFIPLLGELYYDGNLINEDSSSAIWSSSYLSAYGESSETIAIVATYFSLTYRMNLNKRGGHNIRCVKI